MAQLRRLALTLSLVASMAACAGAGAESPAQSPTSPASAATVGDSPHPPAAITLDCLAGTKTLQTYPSGRTFADVERAASWSVPRGGSVGVVVWERPWLVVVALNDASGAAVAEVTLHRTAEGYARDARTSCA